MRLCRESMQNLQYTESFEQIYLHPNKRLPIYRKNTSNLWMLYFGMGHNAICRQEDVTGGSVRSWIILASEQVSTFTAYMQRDMRLELVQIDEFWSFIRKKRDPK